MLSVFENYVQENQLFSKQDHVLLAFSSGMDSVFLFEMLLKNGYNFSVAHCNFQLRGTESELDESFAIRYCQENKIQIHVKKFNTKLEAENLKCGTQETARILRYQWFSELLSEHQYAFLLTAHHQSDLTETVFINLLRSTGISGLHGILPKKNQIIRPLLFVNRTQIEKYINKQLLPYRHDKSNDGDDYLRNNIRHHVIPILKEIEPNLDSVISKVSAHVFEYEQLAENLIQKHWNMHVSSSQDGYHIPYGFIEGFKNPDFLMYSCLKIFGFKAQSFNHIERMSFGAKLYSNTWVLIKERDGFDLKKNDTLDDQSFSVNELPSKIHLNHFQLTFSEVSVNEVCFSHCDTLYLDLHSCQFPLTIRTWKPGDIMQPLGLKGHKKISDILTDKKIRASERNTQMVLVDAQGQIMALLPTQCSEVHKIGHNTKRALAIRTK